MEPAALLPPAEKLTSQASSRQPGKAGLAGAATGGEGAGDQIALPESFDLRTGLDNLADKLVSHRRSLIESGLTSVVDV